MIRDFHNLIPKKKSARGKKPRPVREQARAEDGLRVLLLYRALLCACVCATAADISCVEGTALGQQVVQIL
jgi:hypothetical protein